MHRTRNHRTIRTRLLALLGALLALAATAAAQEPIAGEDFDWEQFQPYGDVETTYEAIDDPEFGAIVLRHSTPADQEANFDVVGPDGFWQHFDFSDDEGDEHLMESLVPGVYSIAASDEGLQLAHTVVQVRAGEAASVIVNLQVWEAGAFEAGYYDPREYYGAYAADEDFQPGYPYGAYRAGPYTPYGEAASGSLILADVPADVEVVVTGPNGFSEGYEETIALEGLPPGAYAIAATGEGMEASVTTVEVRAAQQLELTPSLAPLE